MKIRAPGTARGVTLVELLVTVAIVGTVAAFALPMYGDYLTRGRIPEATSGLANKRARIEMFYDNRRTYVGAPDCSPDGGQYFNFSCTGKLDEKSYTITAAGKGPMSDFIYTVNQSNVRVTSKVPAGWTASGTCWVTRPDGTC